MINELRRKFILIAMTAFTLTLVLIIGSINLLSYLSVEQGCAEKLHIIAENKGDYPMEDQKPHLEPDFKPDTKPNRRKKLNAETPYELRYFSVTLDQSGTVINTDIRKIASISREEAEELAQSVYTDSQQEGYWADYKYLVKQQNNNVMVVFLDCFRERDNYRSFLRASLGIGTAGELLVFLLVVLFSRRAIRPMAESYEKQKRFITDASHEIKTPLTIIDANTEVLEMLYGENEWTQSSRNQVARLAELTRKLVLLSRMEEGITPMEMTDFSLSEAVEEAAEPFRSVAQAAGKELSLSIESDVIMNGNEASIRQMISLLLDNATKYAKASTIIALSLSKRGKHSVIKLTNQADGLTRGRYDVLFERFYRPDASRSSETGGYGIGLSVVRSIVTAHKGKISAGSEDGQSLTFTILF